MNNTESSIPLPKDPRHQRFADLVLGGENAAKAYVEAGFTAKSPQVRSANASRLLKRADVRAYMEEIRKRAADDSVMDLLERRRFYARIVRTPLMAIDPNDPARKNGDIIKKFKRSEFGYELEKLCPLKACELDTKAAGEDSESNALGDLAEAFRAIGAMSSGPIPTDKL
jgi:hypothetical protein